MKNTKKFKIDGIRQRERKDRQRGSVIIMEDKEIGK